MVVNHDDMTRPVQSLHVSVSKPFENHLQKECESWFLPENFLLRTSDKIKKATVSKLKGWRQ